MLVGKDSLLATIMIAQGFMDFDETMARQEFADEDLEKVGKLTSLGNDGSGNEVFGAVFKYPEIAAKISDEIKALKIDSSQDLKVIPVAPNLGSVPLLIAFSKIPGFGFWFKGLIRSSICRQKTKLFQKGQVLRVLYVTGRKPQRPPVAAKPQH